MTTGLAFFVSIFFAPIFASIPSWATGGALVIVGTFMIRNVREINWDYIGDAIPAFLTIIMIPLTYKYASFPHLGSCSRGDMLTLNTQHLIRCHRGHMFVHIT
jgi:xanthine/uracil/vitamin C permease (AzgA family)